MQAYVGQLLLVPYNFAPVGWFFCQGQLLPISEYEVLFQLIGTTYGGDGQSTFALPDLRGRVALHQGQGPGLGNYVIGEVLGVETVTLTTQTTPTHTHAVGCSTNNANSNVPNNGVLAVATDAYSSNAPSVQLAPTSLTPAGGSQPHDNMQPYTTLNWIIAWEGIFPTQN